MDVKDSNLTDLARRFWREGYLVIEDFYSASVMAGMDREIVGWWGETP